MNDVLPTEGAGRASSQTEVSALRKNQQNKVNDHILQAGEVQQEAEESLSELRLLAELLGGYNNRGCKLDVQVLGPVLMHIATDIGDRLYDLGTQWEAAFEPFRPKPRKAASA